MTEKTARGMRPQALSGSMTMLMKLVSRACRVQVEERVVVAGRHCQNITECSPIGRSSRQFIHHITVSSIISEGSSKMVYYFTSNVVDPAAQIYVGKDKFESTSRTLRRLETAD